MPRRADDQDGPPLPSPLLPPREEREKPSALSSVVQAAVFSVAGWKPALSRTGRALSAALLGTLKIGHWSFIGHWSLVIGHWSGRELPIKRVQLFHHSLNREAFFDQLLTLFAEAFAQGRSGG